ncbi:MAG: hypothetical protein ACREM2_06545, partial [Vulcanimicrobiaceae bacterium]
MHPAAATIPAFLASLVECVEALTIVLAVGATRGWRSAFAGALGALVVLALAVALLGPALLAIPLRALELGIGFLVLLFGMRWLQKAALRYAGTVALHDEGTIYERKRGALALEAHRGVWDAAGVATAFNGVALEGLEVVFIVLSLGATARAFGPPALGAA